MSGLAARGLRFRYPAQPGWALAGVDFQPRAGEVTWLTGALGSGTSTLLLALAGLAPRLTGGTCEGDVTLDAAAVQSLRPLGAGIAYLGAAPALQLSGIARTVRDEVAVGPMNLGWPRDHILAVVDEALDRFEVRHLIDRSPTALSGGETQRVLLAALHASAPRIWLLDEPLSALDYRSRQLVSRVLSNVARDGATVVITCDDADAMTGWADRLVVLRHGQVALDGRPAELLGGEAILAADAGTTDAASLAAAAGWPAPRPLDTGSLLAIAPAPVRAVPTARRSGEGSTPSSSPPILQLEGVHFAYRVGPPVLDGVDLVVRPGEAVGLFGPNGAGKSTLLRLAMALEHPTAGIVRTLGRATAGLRPEDFAPRAGFLFQQPERQLFASSVRAECAVSLRLAGWPDERIAAAVTRVLEELDLMDVADEHPYDLPVPRRRLVALAAVLVADPELLLLDEPTAALDAKGRERVAAVVRRRVARGLGALVITHDAAFAHEAVDRALRLDAGHLTAERSVRDVLDGHALPRPAALGVAVAFGLPEGEDRRQDVATALAHPRPGVIG